MGFLRFLILVLAVFLVYSLAKRLFGLPGPAQKTTVSRLIRCEHCGLFFPSEEAVLNEGHAYCSRKHLDLASRLY